MRIVIDTTEQKEMVQGYVDSIFMSNNKQKVSYIELDCDEDEIIIHTDPVDST